MDKKDFPIVKEMLLAMSRMQESITALGIVLREHRILDHAGYLAAHVMAQEMNRATREKIEKLDALDPMIELPKEFQGPLQ